MSALAIRNSVPEDLRRFAIIKRKFSGFNIRHSDIETVLEDVSRDKVNEFMDSLSPLAARCHTVEVMKIDAPHIYLVYNDEDDLILKEHDITVVRFFMENLWRTGGDGSIVRYYYPKDLK